RARGGGAPPPRPPPPPPPPPPPGAPHAAAQGAGAPAAPGAQGPAPDTPGERVLLAVDDGTPLDDPEFGGADLLVGRVVVTDRPAPGDAPGAVGPDPRDADAP
ncbi:hypothetical protein I6A84_17525, partial [Frankia sp. CNm7]|nr:hypothetical protein [Frankia nepalensis]